MKRSPGTRPGALAQRLVALCLAGWLLFDFPLLKLLLGGPDAAPTLFGLPRGPLALFAAWALLIVLLAWLMERAEPDEAAAPEAAGLPAAPLQPLPPTAPLPPMPPTNPPVNGR